MADRNFYRDAGSMNPGVVKLFAKVTIGATGAPTLTIGKGVTSIGRTSAGLYVLTLADKYQRTIGFSGTFVAASGIPAAPLPPCIKTDLVATTKAITFTTGAASGASGAFVATDPANGDILLLEITLSNSSAL